MKTESVHGKLTNLETAFWVVFHWQYTCQIYIQEKQKTTQNRLRKFEIADWIVNDWETNLRETVLSLK